MYLYRLQCQARATLLYIRAISGKTKRSRRGHHAVEKKNKVKKADEVKQRR